MHQLILTPPTTATSRASRTPRTSGAGDVFSPPSSEVERAKRIIADLENAASMGKGAAQIDGRMIDAASERMANNIVNIDNLISKKIDKDI